MFVRFEAAAPNARGARPGVFALANGLARAGRLSPDDHAWWRLHNDRLDAAYPDPARADPALFDRTLHPHWSCWFKASATDLLAEVPGYLDLLDRYAVGWAERRSTTPGVIRYEDEVQVVVTST